MGLNELAGGPFRRIEPGSAARRAEEARAAEADAATLGAATWGAEARLPVPIRVGTGARKAEQERAEGVRPQHGFQLRAGSGKPFAFPEEAPATAGEALPVLRTPVERRRSSQPEPATPTLEVGKPDGASAQTDSAAHVQQPGRTSASTALTSTLFRLKALVRRRRPPVLPR